MPSSDPLPPKESAIFRKILKCYEMKQYKNGLKLAKQILTNPKFTEHGETLAMKGLTLNCMGRKDEAYDHVRRGLRNSLKSHVCWHVYGLLQRSDKKYDEAIKCYRNALKCEKDNIQILRDLSLLQIQMRDLEGYRETRHQLFKLRPSQHASWIGFAMSYHLLGDHETANSILDTFRQSQQLNETYDYKHSELLLYQNQILQESGNLEKALRHLRDFSGQICDKLAVKETMGDLLLRLQQYEQAAHVWEDLIRRNPENTLYYERYLEAMRYADGATKVAAYRGFQEKYPHAICPKRLPLNVADGELFEEIADQYLRRGLRKGIPPLFNNIRSIYAKSRDGVKVQCIERLVQSYRENLECSGHFSVSDREAEVPAEPATALLWTLFFLAQHYDHLRDSVRALKYIDEAIEHTPTLIELFVAKGRIFKHAGDLAEAGRWLDEAQSLDTADRYINSKCAKYMLRANMVQLADDVCSKFTREDVPAMDNLNEMQCMWFQTECALAYQRQERWGDALKKCHEVDRHFSEIIEDQFDFHTYCMRKMTLRAYVGLLRLEDVLRQHPFYFKAARCAIEVYLRLWDHPLQTDQQIEEADAENLPAAELKKLRNKQRKAKKKAEQDAALAAQAAVRKEQHNKSRQQANGGGGEGDPEAPQLDELVPDKLARPDDALERATDFLRPLQLLAANNIRTHLLAFEIYSRRGRLLLQLQAIKRARQLDSNDALLHGCTVRFLGAIQQRNSAPSDANGGIAPAVRTVIERETAQLFGGRSADELNLAFLDENRTSAEAVLQVGRCSYELASGLTDASAAAKQRADAIRLVTAVERFERFTLEQCTDIYNYLSDGVFGSDGIEVVLAEFKANSRKLFPYALLFKDQSEVTTTKMVSAAFKNLATDDSKDADDDDFDDESERLTGKETIIATTTNPHKATAKTPETAKTNSKSNKNKA